MSLSLKLSTNSYVPLLYPLSVYVYGLYGKGVYGFNLYGY